MRTRARWLTLGLVAVLWTVTPVHAYYLDGGRRFDFRMRAYAQASIAARKNQINEPPFYTAGNVMQQRNFYNPEFDAKLTDFTKWMEDTPYLEWARPDDFKVRAAGWGFYDGVFDYINPKWNDARRARRVRAASTDTSNTIASRTFNDDNKSLRDELAHDVRLNELYVDYTNGPFFLRLGKQAISWGESDTIALLDVSNPFDLRVGAPGFFQDVDEARIPLWTVRSTMKLVDNWKFLSSGFLDAYMVPGPIDTTVSTTPTWFGLPYSAPGNDPQVQNINSQGLGSALHIDLVDKLPKNEWKNTRWGARLTGVLFRDYTVQGWFFRTFNQQPVPLLLGPPSITRPASALVLIDDRGRKVPSCVAAGGGQAPRALGSSGRTPAGRPCSWASPIINTLNHELESVVGLAGTWYSPMVNGIIRAEAEYFIDELAFIPSRNINPEIQNPITNPNGTRRNSIPTANYLRWTLGYDTFFFMRALNPANSFIFSGQFNGQWNTSESTNNDYKSALTKVGPNGTLLPQACSGVGVAGYRSKFLGRTVDERVREPSCQGAGFAVPDSFWTDQHRFDSMFFTLALQSDYLHGRLTPRLVSTLDVRGTYSYTLSATYRLTDSFLLSGAYLAIFSNRLAGLGTFLGRDQFQLRFTYQLN